MEEVPGSEESLLVLDEQPALTGQNEEGLLIRLGVVNAALAGLEDGHIDPELRELDRRLAVFVGEPTRRAPRLRREPLGIAHVDDKPTLGGGGKPGASVLKPRFVHAQQILAVQATAVSSGPAFRNDARGLRVILIRSACEGYDGRQMWRKGDPVNPALAGYLCLDRILIFVLSPVLLLALIGAVVSRKWISIPIVVALGLMLYGMRRFACGSKRTPRLARAKGASTAPASP